MVRPSHRLPGSSLDYDSFLFDDGFSDGAGSGFLGGEILPKCSYWNTEFRGDDVGDGRGLTAGSAYACKQACIDQDSCQYWTYRRGWARDCYLKRRGNSRGSNKLSICFCISLNSLLQMVMDGLMLDRTVDSSQGHFPITVTASGITETLFVPLEDEGAPSFPGDVAE